MKFGVLGTGSVGATISSRLIELGHEVTMGSRTAENEKAVAFAARFPGKAHAGTFADAAAFGEIIINCTAGRASLEVLSMAGSANLSGKILIDLSNPLDFSNGMPPSLSVVNTDSLGEQIQRAFPDTRVVKTLNTMWCGIMVNPALIGGGDHHVFVCGNDESAKQATGALLQSFGWPATHILDLGDITKSRGTEMYLPLWLSIYGTKGAAAFNIKIVS